MRLCSWQMNETVTQVELQLSLNAIKNWKFLIYLQMEQSFSMQARFPSIHHLWSASSSF